MASITTRAGKGSPLTNAEVDANFTNLNTELGQKLPSAGGTLTGNLTIGSDPTSNVSALNLGGYNQVGGVGYHGFLALRNTFGSATNPNKWLRLNSAGGIEIVNNAYTSVIFALSDAGVLSGVTMDASVINTGTIAAARLGSGTASSSTYLRGDGTWATVQAGVSSFNTRTGAISLTSADVTGALGYTPLQSSDLSSYLTSASASSTYLPLSGGTLGGSLTFSGTGRRIIGDFSDNVTVSNRLAFQTSTANGPTVVGAIPNGTSTIARYVLFGTSDPGNGPALQLSHIGTEARITSNASGTGSVQPLTFYMGTTEAYRVDTSARMLVGFNTNQSGDKLQVNGLVWSNTGFTSYGATGNVFTANANGTGSIAAIFQNTGGNLYIGRDSSAGGLFGYANAHVLFGTGANPLVVHLAGAERFRFGDSGQLGIAGANYGTSGQFLKSGGASAAPSWGSLTSGEVTTALGFTPYNSTNPSGYITNSALGNYLPLTGGTLSGSLYLSANAQGAGVNSTLRVNGDITAARGNGTSGVIFLGNSGGTYVYYDGTNYYMPNGALINNGQVVLRADNYSSYALPLSGGTLSGAVTSSGSFTSTDNANVNGSNFVVDTTNKSTALYAFDVRRSGSTVGGITIGGVGVFAGGTTIGGSTALHAGNYTSYLNNTYMRSIGYASSSNDWNSLGNSYPNTVEQVDPTNFSSTANGPTAASYTYGTLLNFASQSSSQAQIYISHAGNDLIFRGGWNGASWQAWNKVLTNQNYTSYSPSLTGSGASGTWGISITGSAATLGGKPPQDAVGANTIPTRDGSGYTYFNYINSNTGNGENPTVSQVIVTNGSDGFYRKASIGHLTSNLSGTAPISVTGYSYGTSVLDTDRSLGNRLPTSTGQSVRFDFANASVTGTGGNYAGVMTFSPWTGTTSSTGDASYQLAFGSTATNGGGNPQLRLRKGIDSTWNSWIDLLTSANFSSYAVPTRTRSNWNDGTVINNVVGQLGWKNYGGNHTIFDASASTSPDGTSVNNTNAAVPWTGSYPTLMGWNGSSTYGVRVDSARVADSAGSSPLLSALGSYVWSASTNGRSFNAGIQASFVNSSIGYQSYGSVVRINTYPNDGGSAELYFPYSAAYGGSSMQYRLGQYDNAGWTAWKTVLDSTNFTNYAPGSGSDWTFGAVYANNWFRSYNNTGIYNQTHANHFYADGQYWNVAYSGTTGIRFRNGHGGTTMGWIYAQTDQNWGLLTAGGSWAVQIYPGGGGNLNGSWTIGGSTPITTANVASYVSAGGGPAFDAF